MRMKNLKRISLGMIFVGLLTFGFGAGIYMTGEAFRTWAE